jgi:phospholipid/cholesterol/gamma-HCH transport system substrate-binding protein
MAKKLAGLAAFLLVSYGLSVVIGAKIQGFSFQGGYQLSATFDDVTQLFHGDPVYLAGVKVGQVKSIHLVHGKAQVRFSVARSVRLARAGTVVSVRWRNLIAQRELDVSPGPNADRATDFLPTNGTGVVDQANSAVDVSALLSALGPLGQDIDPHQLNTIFTALAQAVDGNGTSIDNLVRNLNGVVAMFAQRAQTIGQMVADYHTLSGVLSQRDQQIQTMLDNVTQLSRSFTDNTKLFLSVLDKAGSLAPNLDKLLASNESQLRGILDSTASVLGTVKTKLPQLEQAMKGIPPALQAVFSTTAQGNFVQFDLTCFQFQRMPCNVLGGYSVP